MACPPKPPDGDAVILSFRGSCSAHIGAQPADYSSYNVCNTTTTGLVPRSGSFGLEEHLQCSPPMFPSR